MKTFLIKKFETVLEEDGTIVFQDVMRGRNKGIIAISLCELLTLASKEIVEVNQEDPYSYGDIVISRTSNLSEY